MKKCAHCGGPNPDANAECYGCHKSFSTPAAPAAPAAAMLDRDGEAMPPDWVLTGYKKIRTRQIAGSAVGILLLVLLAWGTKGAVWSAPLYLFVFAGIAGFIWWNWKCPACDEFLAKSRKDGTGGFCRSCGERLWE